MWIGTYYLNGHNFIEIELRRQEGRSATTKTNSCRSRQRYEHDYISWISSGICLSPHWVGAQAEPSHFTAVRVVALSSATTYAQTAATNLISKAPKASSAPLAVAKATLDSRLMPRLQSFAPGSAGLRNPQFDQWQGPVRR